VSIVSNAKYKSTRFNFDAAMLEMKRFDCWYRSRCTIAVYRDR